MDGAVASGDADLHQHRPLRVGKRAEDFGERRQPSDLGQDDIAGVRRDSVQRNVALVNIDDVGRKGSARNEWGLKTRGKSEGWFLPQGSIIDQFGRRDGLLDEPVRVDVVLDLLLDCLEGIRQPRGELARVAFVAREGERLETGWTGALLTRQDGQSP